MQFGLLARWLIVRRLAALARELADAAFGPVRQAAAARALAMPRPEAKGYIRGKATPIVDRCVTVALASGPAIGDAARLQLAEKVTERVVRLVLEDVLRTRAAASLRRAA